MKKLFVLLFSTVFMMSAAYGQEAPSCPLAPSGEKPEHSGSVLRLVTYNVLRFSYDAANYPQGNYAVIASMMNEVEADVVCLNEIDEGTNRSWKDDQMKVFAAQMGGWDYVYGRAMPFDGGYYGEGIVTREKMVKRVLVQLPKGAGAEPRVMALAEMETYIVATTHLDHANEAAHAGQIDAINAYIEANYGDSAKPIFLAGDLNARPDSQSIARLREQWTILSPTDRPTFPSHNPKSCIDYIAAWKSSSGYTVTRSEVLTSFAAESVARSSDHLPVLAVINIPEKEADESK